jgi:hypothetical protein
VSVLLKRSAEGGPPKTLLTSSRVLDAMSSDRVNMTWNQSEHRFDDRGSFRILASMDSDRVNMTWDRSERRFGKDGDSPSAPKTDGDASIAYTSGYSPVQLPRQTPTLQGQHVQQETTDHELTSRLQGCHREVDWVDLGNEGASESREVALPEASPWLVRQELLQRDKEAVAYSRSLLFEGDTLIYITYPPSNKWFNPAGIETSVATFRVRSNALLNTRSKIFADLLGPTQQFRIQRRKKLIGHLPEGVKYVLDLTPPEEGDEAVELTSDLSCSLGVRLWYTAEYRMSILHGLVGGEDTLTLAQRFEFLSPVIKGQAFYNRGIGDVAHETRESTSKKNGYLDNPMIDRETVFQQSEGEYAKSNVKFAGGYIDKNPENPEKDLQYAIELSKALMPPPKVPVLREVPDYCQVRHRDGIVRLLQVIEGKYPTLDSAPKVWTLYALAKFFDCTSTVVSL